MEAQYPSAKARIHSLQLEFLGKAFLYSLNLERDLGERLSIGAGFSYDPDLKKRIHNNIGQTFFVPLYANIALLKKPNRVFMILGLNSIFAFNRGGDLSERCENCAPDKAEKLATTMHPILGFGHEMSFGQGWAFRSAGYFMPRSLAFPISLGFSFGYHF